MNDDTDYMICYNCRHFENKFCQLKKRETTRQSNCIDFDENHNPGHTRKSSEEVSRELKLKNLRIDTVYDNVKLYHEEQPFFYDRNQNFWFWNKELTKYSLVDEIDLMNSLDEQLSLNGHTIKSTYKNEYLEAFKRIGRLKIPKEPPKEWIQFKNKVVNINTGEEHEATPEYHFTNPISYNIGESDKTPKIDKIFTEWVGKENVDLLHEIIAFCIMPDYFLHRMFCLVGSGSNGKSKYLELLKKFIGHDNTTTTDLDLLLNSRFEVTKLYKKLVCLFGETNFNKLEKTGLLKRLTGQDIIGFEFKNKTPFDDVNYAKIIIATNSLPITTDKSEGFYRRWTIIDFPNKFSEKKDILKGIPEAEYNNLANKSIKKLQKLLREREFTNEQSIEERKQKYEDTSNPLQKFLRERTTEDPNSYIFKYEFKNKFLTYLSDNGYRIWSDTELGIHMKEQFQDAQRGENLYRAWLGLTWNSQGSQGSHPNLTQSRVYRTKWDTPVNPVNPVSEEEFIVDEPKKVIKTPKDKINISEQIKASILTNDDSFGVKTQEIIQFVQSNGFVENSMIEKSINDLKRDGEIFEVKPDLWKLI